MKKPLLHSRSEKLINLYLKNPVHGLALNGPRGVGKTYVARWIAEQNDLKTHLVTVLEDETVIKIEQIRELYSLTKTGVEQAIIIDEAHLMSQDAQNAFLKLLEEPPEHTYFILTVDKAKSLLGTISSRVQTVELTPPTTRQFLEYYKDTSQDFIKLINSLGFMPARIHKALNSEETANISTEQMNLAKTFYAGDAYTRNKILIEQKHEKDATKELTDNLMRIVQSLIKIKSDDKTSLTKLLKQAKIIETTVDNIQNKPGNPKIHLTLLAEVL